MGLNYIIFEVKDKRKPGLVREIPIIYPDLLVHDEVANALKPLIEGGNFEATPISAGSIELHIENCYGKSSTLNLVSRGDEDESLINSFPYFHGIR